MQTLKSLEELDPLWKRFKILPNGCWQWLGGKASNTHDRRPVFRNKYVYRVIWEHLYGPIPKGRVCCHICDNSLCVNPEHIFIGTQKDNMLDALSKNRKIGRTPKKTQLTLKILTLKSQGLSDYRIGKILGIDHSTVAHHWKQWGSK